MTDQRRKMGDFGEQAAATFLFHKGYAEVARKWHCLAGEIDLIVRDGAMLVFVEVRTRRSALVGTAEESVGVTKRAKLIELAYAYLEAHTLPETTSWRIDVVAIDLDRSGRVARINHIPYAVEDAS